MVLLNDALIKMIYFLVRIKLSTTAHKRNVGWAIVKGLTTN